MGKKPTLSPVRSAGMLGSGLVGTGLFPASPSRAPRRSRLCKGCHRYRALARQLVAMPFDAVNFV